MSGKLIIFATDMRHLFLILYFVFAAALAGGATERWERVDAPVRVSAVTADAENEDVEIAVREGYVYIDSPEPVEVRVFTILGQLISQEKLQSGVHRFRLASRGIYILKIGSMTRRVTI